MKKLAPVANTDLRILTFLFLIEVKNNQVTTLVV